MKNSNEQREFLKSARRIVVKAGTRVLVQRNGRPDGKRIETLVSEIAALQHRGCQMTSVSSGAVGAGIEALGMKTRPKAVADLQMAAAVGQTRLMSLYDKLYSKRKCQIGQILLTHDALKVRERHLNARNTMMNLLRNGIIPVVNENDTVSTEEIQFGDNDLLAVLVSILVDADALVLLTTADGLREPAGNNRTRRVKCVQEINDDILGLAHGKGSELSSGGMASKLTSAREATRNGIPVIIANGRKDNVLENIFTGKDEGTLFLPKETTISKRKSWLAFFHRVEGTLTVDDGAATALREKGKSLLPIGIKAVDGKFGIGSLIRIQTKDGHVIARGLSEFSSEAIQSIKGTKTTNEYAEVIHRDNLVIL
ncbi:glutamate 5-kinase [Verrucomicrobiota bacterium]